MNRSLKKLSLVACLTLSAIIALPANAATIVLNVTDGAAEGFNDPTSVAPVTGNPATTLGAQRFNVMQAAADYWGNVLFSNVDILVDVSFDPLTCTASGALLGFAGPQFVAWDFQNAPLPNVVYPAALVNSLAGSDLFGGSAVIASTFNSNLDLGANSCLSGNGWDYRLGVSTGSSLEFYATALHELAHGLGFLSLVDLNTGAKFTGRDDTYSRNLLDRTVGLDWPQMSNAQRLQSSVNTGELVWTGPFATAQSGILTNGNTPDGIQMYAPNPVAPGSSVSHWDTALFPNELMEPTATVNPDDLLTTNLFFDIGWLPNNTSSSLCNGLAVTVDLAAGDSPTAGNDVILGTVGPDTIVALGGNDTICSLSGNDTINAGPGSDWVDAGSNDDRIFGLAGNDTLIGGPGVDEIIGGAGNDIIKGNANGDTLNGGLGDDIIEGGIGNDTIFGQDGDDEIFGDSGNDFILGGNGLDIINGQAGNDTINGGNQADTISGGIGNDVIFGLAGADVLLGGQGNDTIFGQLGNDFIEGGPGDDLLLGNEGDDTLGSFSGENTMNGGPGNDQLDGGSGDDTLFGDGNVSQAGDDTISGGAGSDRIIGFAGNDALTSDDDGTPSAVDVVNGGPGIDICSTDGTDTVFNCE